MGSQTPKITLYHWGFVTLPEKDRATAVGNTQLICTEIYYINSRMLSVTEVHALYGCLSCGWLCVATLATVGSGRACSSTGGFLVLVIPRFHDTTGCLTRSTTVLNEQPLFVQLHVLNEQSLFVQLVVKPGCTTSLTTDLTTGCIHDTAGCKTGCQTGFTTRGMFVYMIQLVVKPV